MATLPEPATDGVFQIMFIKIYEQPQAEPLNYDHSMMTCLKEGWTKTCNIIAYEVKAVKEIPLHSRTSTADLPLMHIFVFLISVVDLPLTIQIFFYDKPL